MPLRIWGLPRRHHAMSQCAVTGPVAHRLPSPAAVHRSFSPRGAKLSRIRAKRGWAHITMLRVVHEPTTHHCNMHESALTPKVDSTRAFHSPFMLRVRVCACEMRGGGVWGRVFVESIRALGLGLRQSEDQPFIETLTMQGFKGPAEQP